MIVGDYTDIRTNATPYRYFACLAGTFECVNMIEYTSKDGKIIRAFEYKHISDDPFYNHKDKGTSR